jgi:hypothetical protein
MSVVKKFFNELLPNAISDNPQTFKEIGYQYTFKITGEGGGEWYVNASNSNSGPLVRKGDLGEFDCHITMTTQQCQQCCQNPNNFMVLIVNNDVELSRNLNATPGILTGVLRIFGLGQPFGLGN